MASSPLCFKMFLALWWTSVFNLNYYRYMLFRAGVPRHAIIKKFAGEEISRLEELISVLSKLSRGARVPLEYVSYTDRHRRKVSIIILSIILPFIFGMREMGIILHVTLCHYPRVCILDYQSHRLRMNLMLFPQNRKKKNLYLCFPLLFHER